MTWTTLDRDILTALTCQVRVMSEPQLHRVWSESTDAVAVSVERLTATRLIVSESWTVTPPLIGSTPVVTWKPGEVSPDTWRVSETVRTRWQRSEVTLTVYRATELAGRLFGSRTGHPIRIIERRHDLLLAEVYVLYRLRLPKLAAHWVGEQAMPMAERGVKNPDAFLLDGERTVRRVIESSGSYSQHQVLTFHEYCRLAQRPYELW
jgi:hypothetical protein